MPSIAKHSFIRHIPISNNNHSRRRLFFFHCQNSMDINQTERDTHHVHYNHTDPSKFARWNARESFEFMYARPWQRVNDFYLNTVRANSSLHLLFQSQTLPDHDDSGVPEISDQNELECGVSKDRSGKWARFNFKIVLSYHGGSFDGWQKQPSLYTVQSIVEASLGKFVDENKTQLLKDKGLPIEGCAAVAGRTDKGVTALHQVCSFYTWKKDIKPREIEDAINDAAPGKLRVVSVYEVSRAFHPNFSAKWRRYLYIFPLTDGWDKNQSRGNGESCESFTYNEICDSVSKDELGNEKKSYVFSVRKVNRLLQQLEGKLLSYKMFARDTKASRNDGPPTECFVHHARAMEARLPITENGEETKVMCIELVANRFLRKMVRVLVATTIREAAAGAEDDALLKLMDATCRRATAPPAPPDGLCLVDVGYVEFDREKCFIMED
ncbi:tRNA pseudouridine synthase A [Trifolium pratense]|uniref:tRNA pseudouridine synthase A n=1 Tax=Trifolium pratense TaxID=57577 RepID=UPI001E698348|nr:tRNA pseudouridine synthase A [Trifolium pratense]